MESVGGEFEINTVDHIQSDGLTPDAPSLIRESPDEKLARYMQVRAPLGRVMDYLEPGAAHILSEQLTENRAARQRSMETLARTQIGIR